MNIIFVVIILVYVYFDYYIVKINPEKIQVLCVVIKLILVTGIMFECC